MINKRTYLFVIYISEVQTNMLSKNDDYGYIQMFINYLKQIIDMIVALFNGMGSSNTTTPDAGEEDKKEENAG